MIRINKNLAQFLVLLFVFGGILLLIVQKFFPVISHLTYLCQSLISSHTVSIPYYLSIIPFLYLFLIFSFSVGKTFLLALKIKLFKYKLKGKSIINHEVDELITNLGLKKKVCVIHSSNQFAFCLGLRNPKIYISTGLITALSPEEIKAVLRHEEYHLKNHDSFTMIIASVAHSLFPFFPILSDLINKYRIEREIKADAFAVSKLGNSQHLVQALKKILASPSGGNIAFAAIADEDTLEPRILTLLNQRYLPKKFRTKNLLVTFFSLIIIGTVAVVPVYAEELHHNHYDVLMLAPDKESINFCTIK